MTTPPAPRAGDVIVHCGHPGSLLLVARAAEVAVSVAHPNGLCERLVTRYFAACELCLRAAGGKHEFVNYHAHLRVGDGGVYPTMHPLTGLGVSVPMGGK